MSENLYINSEIIKLGNRLRYLAWALIAFAVCKALFGNYNQSFGILDYVVIVFTTISVLFALWFLVIGIKLIRIKGDQFIEWKADNITYKLKGDKEKIIIPRSIITNKQVNLDIIKITDNKNRSYDLNISDIFSFKKRNQIKAAFEE